MTFQPKLPTASHADAPFWYAPREYPFVKDLEQFHCARIASTPQELHQLLLQCKDCCFCDSTLENATQLAEQNHNAQKECGGYAQGII